jgi:uridine phosphorylase
VRSYPPSELALNERGAVYHLGILPSEISEKIILVGDQDRVEMISVFFDSIEHSSRHREFVCHTGTYKGKRITALSTGIGTDNIDITVNELDALFNLDLLKRTEKDIKTSLEMVRIGTCGILQPDIPVHSYILSNAAFGLDNVAHFYQLQYLDEERKLCNELRKHLELPKEIQPYLVFPNDALTNKFSSEHTYEGITVTSSGFYGPQGRQLRIPNRVDNLNGKLTNFRLKEWKVTNFEMESSAIFALGRHLGHACATICLGVANRPNLEFSKGYHREMGNLIQYVLDRI